MSNKQRFQKESNRNPQQYNVIFEEQKQQIQKLSQQQAQELHQMRYYLYENFQFLINLVYQLKAVNEHFQNQPLHPMKQLARNKIILQLNLSNTIHFDQEYQYKSDPKLNQQLFLEKQNAKQLLDQLSPELKEEFGKYFEIYKKNSLNDNIAICQEKLEQTNLNASFNQEVVSQLFKAIIDTDNTIKQFKENKKYDRPTIEDVNERANYYYEMTKQKLECNFPNGSEKEIQNSQEDEQTPQYQHNLVQPSSRAPVKKRISKKKTFKIKQSREIILNENSKCIS